MKPEDTEALKLAEESTSTCELTGCCTCAAAMGSHVKRLVRENERRLALLVRCAARMDEGCKWRDIDILNAIAEELK